MQDSGRSLKNVELRFAIVVVQSVKSWWDVYFREGTTGQRTAVRNGGVNPQGCANKGQGCVWPLFLNRILLLPHFDLRLNFLHLFRSRQDIALDHDTTSTGSGYIDF